MTEPENFVGKFLERWSRRKRAARQAAAGAAPHHEADEASAPTASTERPTDPVADPAAPSFDPASLPPIESINAASDIRAFLAPGVPVELTRAALRRVWTTDPAIRDFIGIAENQWDFTAPDGTPGFGPLKVTEELRRIVSELRGDAAASGAGDADEGGTETRHRSENLPDSTPRQPRAALPADAPVRRSVDDTNFVRPAEAENAAVQDNSGEAAADQPSARRHGRALPR